VSLGRRRALTSRLGNKSQNTKIISFHGPRMWQAATPDQAHQVVALLRHGGKADCYLVASCGGRVGVHGLLLALHSPLLAALLEPGAGQAVSLPASFTSLTDLVSFMYGEGVEYSQELREVAKMLGVSTNGDIKLVKINDKEDKPQLNDSLGLQNIKIEAETEYHALEEETEDHGNNDYSWEPSKKKTKRDTRDVQDLERGFLIVEKTEAIDNECFSCTEDTIELPIRELTPVNHDTENGTQKNKNKRSNSDRLKEPIKSKVENRSSKANVNSFKVKYLTLKKKTSSLQVEVGTEPDFCLIVKNNLQNPNTSNAAPTAGKYMVYCEGPLRHQLLGGGTMFDYGSFYMMANNYDYTEEELNVSS